MTVIKIPDRIILEMNFFIVGGSLLLPKSNWAIRLFIITFLIVLLTETIIYLTTYIKERT